MAAPARVRSVFFIIPLLSAELKRRQGLAAAGAQTLRRRTRSEASVAINPFVQRMAYPDWRQVTMERPLRSAYAGAGAAVPEFGLAGRVAPLRIQRVPGLTDHCWSRDTRRRDAAA